MTAPLGEHPLSPVRGLTRGSYHSDSTRRPPRFACPKRNNPRPSWLPPDKFCCPQDHYLQGKYGITCDQWWLQYEQQGGRCGICGRPFRPGQRIVVDHDHDTGAIDSLAEFGCNRGLRQEHRRYAKNPPGAALGFRVAPAKLRAIQAADAAKRRREAERREERRKRAQAPPVSGGGSYHDNMRKAREEQQRQERSA